MAESGSFADRQTQYAAWRDRLRTANEVIDLDAQEVDEPSDEWSPEALFRSSTVVDD